MQVTHLQSTNTVSNRTNMTYIGTLKYVKKKEKKSPITIYTCSAVKSKGDKAYSNEYLTL